MKILHYLIGRCNPDSANGVEKMVSNLTMGLAKNPENVVYLISLTKKDIIPIPGVNIIRFKPCFIPILLPIKMKKKIWEINPDIVHLHSVYNFQNIIIAYWLKKLKIPYVTSPHGGLATAVLKRKKILKILYKYFFELKYSNRASFVHSSGNTTDIIKYGVNNKFIEIPNGISLSRIPKDCNKKFLYDRYPEIDNKLIILYLGRLDPVLKGLDLLLKAYSLSKLDNTILIIAGPDFKNSKKKLLRLVYNLRITEKVIFTGPVYGKEKYDLLSSADVFVYTSRSEGLPLSVLEAMAMKIPCLVTPAANPLGYIKTGKSGWQTSLDINDITYQISNASKCSKSELMRMGEENYKIIKEYFTWEKIVPRFEIAYREVVYKE